MRDHQNPSGLLAPVRVPTTNWLRARRPYFQGETESRGDEERFREDSSSPRLPVSHESACAIRLPSRSANWPDGSSAAARDRIARSPRRRRLQPAHRSHPGGRGRCDRDPYFPEYFATLPHFTDASAAEHETPTSIEHRDDRVHFFSCRMAPVGTQKRTRSGPGCGCGLGRGCGRGRGRGPGPGYGTGPGPGPGPRPRPGQISGPGQPKSTSTFSTLPLSMAAHSGP